MDIYLMGVNKGKDFHFPVNPEEIKIKTANKINTIDVLDIGEVDFPVGEMRTEIQFSSFLPKIHDSYCRYQNIPNPLDAIKQLEDIRKGDDPVRLLITESPYNKLCLLTELQYVPSKGGEPGDIYFDITFREYRELKVTSVSASSLNLSKLKGRSSKQRSKTYVVSPGDCLWNIAKKELGNPLKWRDIYNLNLKVIGPNPNLIYPGQKYVMPA